MLNFTGKTVLHVGCGGAPLPTWFADAKETRLDISPANNPDIVADMRDFKTDNKFDIVYSAHSLEHLYPHEVESTLSNFKEHLVDGGICFIIVPNLEGIEANNKVIYKAPCGDITGMDMIYGCTRLIKDMPYMAHHTGFIRSTLKNAMNEAGFKNVIVTADEGYNLIGAGMK